MQMGVNNFQKAATQCFLSSPQPTYRQWIGETIISDNLSFYLPTYWSEKCKKFWKWGRLNHTKKDYSFSLEGWKLHDLLVSD